MHTHTTHTHLLFEVPPLLLVHQNEVDVVTDGELLVDVSHGRCQLVTAQEQANGNGLTCGMEWGQEHRLYDIQLESLYINSRVIYSLPRCYMYMYVHPHKQIFTDIEYV